ncbi:uncharacterized protein LOC119458298 isoform X7 [Dermacentor silvarum]|uniref:uncharacterized protein LOC119458298 isoform X4 n=1 Tax=Dermacentor silvarum TaxID=543639 RepID=UPI0021013AEE|nr:uncharacterized protein LOC119458298 isoform X4 [Dermacentor silvarum]XP_049526987.1 uncharacterized protein LOC119458298 isoform X5 [Dermacentor silvarum]XP_049526989.1 uncharacterized protein LOC119458298 isoform X7 [Dermacentor silvarum]
MPRMQLFTVLLFATFVSMLEGKYEAIRRGLAGIKYATHVGTRHGHQTKGHKEYSIAEFLSTPEPIWLYNTTGSINRECEVDQVKTINQTSVLLLRSRYENDTKISGYLQGTLNPDNVDRMFIFNQGIPYNQTENVVYLSTKLRCAVIKVTTLPGMQTIYDLRVRNFSITRGPSRGCMRKWTKLTNKSHSIYAPICQGILHSKTEPEFNTGAKPTPKNEHRH